MSVEAELAEQIQKLARLHTQGVQTQAQDDEFLLVAEQTDRLPQLPDELSRSKQASDFVTLLVSIILEKRPSVTHRCLKVLNQYIN